MKTRLLFLIFSIVLSHSIVAQTYNKGQVMAEKQDSIVYTFEKVYYKNPPLRVPGVGALADSTGIHPMYFPSGDQEFLLL